MTGLKKTFRIKAKDFIHAGEASISVQNLLKSLDFNPQIIRRIAICGYEGEMNVVMHGGDGQLSVEIDTNTLAMEISDNGPGIDPVINGKIFEPFQTTKSSGMGMGLSISHSIIESHDGKLRVDENRKDGASIGFTLPVCD